jgi:hypothetical protein
MTMLFLDACNVGTVLSCVFSIIFGCVFVALTSYWLQREVPRDPIIRPFYRAIDRKVTDIYQTVMQCSKAYMTLYHEYHHGKMTKRFRYDKATNTWVSNEPTTEIAPAFNQNDSPILVNDEQEQILKKKKNHEATIQRRYELAPTMSKQAEEWGFFTNPDFVQVLYLKKSFGEITMEEYDWHLQAWRLYQKKNKVKEQESKYVLRPRRLVPLTNRIRRVVPNQKATPPPMPQKGIYFSINSRPKAATMPSAKTTTFTNTKPPLYPKKERPRKRPIFMVENVCGGNC